MPDIAPIVEAVGGDFVEIVRVMPEGSDPYQFTLTPDMTASLGNCDLIICADTGFFPFEMSLVGEITDVEIVDFPDYRTHGASLTDFPGAGQNPDGYWLGFRNAQAIAAGVATALIEQGLDPVTIMENAASFAESLTSIEKAGKDLIESTGRERSSWIAMVPGVAYTIDNLGLSVGDCVLPDSMSDDSQANLPEIHSKLLRAECAGIVCPLSMKDSYPGELAERISKETGAMVCYVKYLQADEEDTFWSVSAFNAAAMAAAVMKASYSTGGTNPTSSIIWAVIVFVLIVWLTMLYRKLGSLRYVAPIKMGKSRKNRK